MREEVTVHRVTDAVTLLGHVDNTQVMATQRDLKPSVFVTVNGDLLAQSVHLWAVTQMSPACVDAASSHPGQDRGHPDHSLDWDKMGTADNGEWVTSAVGRRSGPRTSPAIAVS
jgi:hypothetical protein